MKRTIRIGLALFVLAAVLMCSISCGVETPSAHAVLRKHIEETVDDGKSLQISDSSQVVSSYLLIRNEKDEDGSSEEKMYLTANAMSSDSSIYRIELCLTPDDASSTEWSFYCMSVLGQAVALAESHLNITEMTGDDVIPFETATGIPLVNEYSYRITATSMTNAALLALDQYCQQNLNLSVDDLGFASLSDTCRYTEEDAANVEEDLGGAFSLERLKLAGTMLLVGMGMVFLVLAILWGVLIIFKKVMYDGANKKAEKTKAAAPASDAAPAPAADDAIVAAVTGVMAYREDDGAIAAAITAAIAETIASDPQLSREFADGFRVVSFKRKSGKSAWNK